VPLAFQGRTVVTQRFVREAHRRNIPVHVWVVNDEATMKRLLAEGIDGIQTDRPDVLSKVLVEVARRPPPPIALRGASSVADSPPRSHA
jgi:glycerophosphoryl diester phosphodiesterase